MSGRVIAGFYFICLIIFIIISKGRDVVYAYGPDGYESDSTIRVEEVDTTQGPVSNLEEYPILNPQESESISDDEKTLVEEPGTIDVYRDNPVVEYGPDANDFSSYAHIRFTNDLVCAGYSLAGECVSRLDCHNDCIYGDARLGFCMPFPRVPQLPRIAANQLDEPEWASYASACLCCFIVQESVPPN